MSLKTLKSIDFSILQQCMHCGMCLPTCPTFQQTQLERHSPRGRIALMRSIAEDRMEISPVFHEEMNFCLGCLACETACPAGVHYNELLEVARSESENRFKNRKPWRTLLRQFLLGIIFSRQGLLRTVGIAMRIYQKSGIQRWVRESGILHLLPGSMEKWEKKMPEIEDQFSHQRIQEWKNPMPRNAIGSEC